MNNLSRKQWELLSMMIDLLTMDDLLSTFALVVPTSKTKKNEIETMRSYVDNGLMRQANYLPELRFRRRG